jgi:hypothetical protein
MVHHVCRTTIGKLGDSMNYGVIVQLGKTLLAKHAQYGTRYKRKYIQLKDVNISSDVGLYIFHTTGL